MTVGPPAKECSGLDITLYTAHPSPGGRPQAPAKRRPRDRFPWSGTAIGLAVADGFIGAQSRKGGEEVGPSTLCLLIGVVRRGRTATGVKARGRHGGRTPPAGTCGGLRVDEASGDTDPFLRDILSASSWTAASSKFRRSSSFFFYVLPAETIRCPAHWRRSPRGNAVGGRGRHSSASRTGRRNHCGPPRQTKAQTPTVIFGPRRRFFFGVGPTRGRRVRLRAREVVLPDGCARSSPAWVAAGS